MFSIFPQLLCIFSLILSLIKFHRDYTMKRFTHDMIENELNVLPSTSHISFSLRLCQIKFIFSYILHPISFLNYWLSILFIFALNYYYYRWLLFAESLYFTLWKKEIWSICGHFNWIYFVLFNHFHSSMYIQI